MADKQYEAGANYLLSRDDAELRRLTDQHILVQKVIFEDRLVYDKKAHLGPGSCVLDAGTGTGAWLMDLAQNVEHSVELQGIDVSPNNFPNPEIIPSNVHFSVSSVTNLPQEWTNKFDVINQRLLIFGLLEVEWPQALAELFRVLKPGGIIQLADLDLPYGLGIGPRCDEGLKALMSLCAVSRLMSTCASRLPGLLEAAGFEEILFERKLYPLGKQWGRMGEMGVRSVRGAMSSNAMVGGLIKGGFTSSEEVYFRLLDDIEKEWDDTASYMVMRLVCACKPL